MAIEPIQRDGAGILSARWWVAQVQAQDEGRVVDAANAWMRKRKVEGFALSPLERVRKTYERRRKTYEERDGLYFAQEASREYTKEWDRPIFPGYVFYCGERDSVFEARQIIRVLDTDEAASEEIANFVRAYEGGPVKRAHDFPIGVGMRVKIVSGAYRNCEGIIERFGDTKVFLRVHSIGWSELDTDRSNIEPFFGD